jgi:glutaredoxin
MKTFGIKCFLLFIGVEMKLILFTSKNCKACERWKKKLIENKYKFVEYDLFFSSEKCKNFQRKHKLFFRSIPVLVAETNKKVNPNNIFMSDKTIGYVLKKLKELK